MVQRQLAISGIAAHAAPAGGWQAATPELVGTAP
jgi:hypothetical protein